MMRHSRIGHVLFSLVALMLVAASCTGPTVVPVSVPSQTSEPVRTITPTYAPTLTPTPTPTPTPSSTPMPVPTPGPPAQTERPVGLPDLAWTGVPGLEPLAPIVGDKLHVKGTWRNTGSAATPSGFNIRLEIRRGNSSVFDQYVEVSQPVKPQEEGTLDVTPEYVIPQPGSYQVVLTLDSEAVVAESHKDNNATRISLLEVPDLSKEPGFNKYPEDMAALVQAEKDIEKYRKGDIALTIVDAAGQPHSGLRVEYAQYRHSFIFDASGSTGDEKVWALLKEAGINNTMVNVSWSSVEPYPGVYRFGPPQTAMVRKFNFSGSGRHLIWLAPSNITTPDYIRRSTFEEFKNAVYPHIFNVVSAYQQYVKRWTVINEPMWQQANCLGLTSKQTIEIIKEGTRAIRDADPNAIIEINNTNAGGDRPGGNPYDFLKEAVQLNVDFDTIGLQMHDYNTSCYSGWPDVSGKLYHYPRRTLASIAGIIDKYSTFGKKIKVTELSLPSNNPPGNQGYWGQLWSPELQAEYLRAACTLFFSKPQVEGIEWAFAADSGSPQFIYCGGLFDEQNRPKKSYYALKQLIRSWTTSGTAITDDRGQISFRGFGGTYDVTITDPKTGLSKKQEVKVEEQKRNSITIVFD